MYVGKNKKNVMEKQKESNSARKRLQHIGRVNGLMIDAAMKFIAMSKERRYPYGLSKESTLYDLIESVYYVDRDRVFLGPFMDCQEICTILKQTKEKFIVDKDLAFYQAKDFLLDVAMLLLCRAKSYTKSFEESEYPSKKYNNISLQNIDQYDLIDLCQMFLEWKSEAELNGKEKGAYTRAYYLPQCLSRVFRNTLILLD